MINLLEGIMSRTIERISAQFEAYAPGILAGLLIVLVAYLFALIMRWLLSRIIKGISFDRFLRQSGLASMLNRSGRVRPAELVANTAFWLILSSGILIGISAFDTQFTTRFTEAIVVLSPKLLAAAAILVAGIWVGRYLGRHVLVWAVNEGLPSGRMLSAIVRILVIMVAVTAAADHLNFARNVFLAALILAGGGVVLTASLSVGLSGRDTVQHYLKEKQAGSTKNEEQSVWRHL